MFDSRCHDTGDSSRTGRKRKLFAPRDIANADAAQALLTTGNVAPICIDLTLHAGQEALKCSGSGWIPKSDLRVVAQGPGPLLLRLAGFRRIEASVNPLTFLQGCFALHS